MPLPKSEMVKLKLDDDARAKLGNELRTKIVNARNAMEGMLDDIEAWRDLYEANLSPKDKPWVGCSNTCLPLIQSHVDSAHAQICSIILGVQPWLLVNVPDELSDEPEIKKRASAVQNMLQSVLEYKMHWESIVDMLVLESLLSTAAIAAVNWREEYKTVKRPSMELDDDGNQRVVLKPQTVPRYRGPWVDLVNMDNFVVAPTSRTSVAQVVIIGHRFKLTHDELRRKVESGEYDDEWVEKIIGSPISENTDSSDNREDEDRNRANLDPTDTEYYKFWQIVTGYDANGDKLNEDCVFVIHEDTGTIVSCREYHYWHGERNYVRIAAFPRPQRFFGRSQPQILEHCQRALNTIHNQRFDANTIRISPMFKKRRGALPAQNDVAWEPGGEMLVDDMTNDFEVIEVNPLTPGRDVEDTYRDYAEKADGVSDQSQGALPRGGNIKATGLNIAAAQGSIRIATIVRRVQEAMVEIAKQVLGLLYQFMPDEELQHYKVDREDLMLPWEIEGHGNTSTANKMQRREESLALYRELGNNPYVKRDPRRGWRISQDLLMAFDRNDTENYIGTESEVEQMLQEMEMQRQQMQAMAAQQGGTAQQPGAIPNMPNIPAQLQAAGNIPQMSPPGGIPGTEI